MAQKINVTKCRTRRIRARINRFSSRTRLSVFRSSKHIYAQLVDVATGKTIATVSDTSQKAKGTKTEKAALVGKTIAVKALEKGITTVVFDRAAYKYHGRVKAVCEAARQAKLVI